MHNLVGTYIAALREPLSALCARVRLLACVSTFMCLSRSISLALKEHQEEEYQPSSSQAERIVDRTLVPCKTVGKVSAVKLM